MKIKNKINKNKKSVDPTEEEKGNIKKNKEKLQVSIELIL